MSLGSSKGGDPCRCLDIPATIYADFNFCTKSGTATLTYDNGLGFWRGGGDGVFFDVACIGDVIWIAFDCQAFSGDFGSGTSGPIGGSMSECQVNPFTASGTFETVPGLLESCECDPLPATIGISLRQ